MRVRDGHLPLRALADLHDGTLEGPRRRDALAHLESGCDLCARRRERLGRILGALAEGPPDEMPGRLRSEVEAMLRAAGFRAPLPPEAYALAIERESSDLPAAHLRSAAGAARRILFRGAEEDVDLEIRARAGGFDVLGQVLPAPGRAPEVGPYAAVIATTGRRTHCAELRADGRFTFRALPPGWLVLEIPRGARTAVLRGTYLR